MARFTHKSDDITDIVTTNARDIAELRRGGGWTEVTEEDLQDKTVSELKADADAAGLPTDGKKSDLVERLSGDTAETTVAVPAPKAKAK